MITKPPDPTLLDMQAERERIEAIIRQEVAGFEERFGVTMTSIAMDRIAISRLTCKRPHQVLTGILIEVLL